LQRNDLDFSYLDQGRFAFLTNEDGRTKPLAER